MNVLCIGNSFSEDATAYLQDVAAGELYVRNLAIGGCSLERHYNNIVGDVVDYQYQENGVCVKISSVSETLKERNWDIITVQQVSHDSGIIDTYEPFLGEIVKYLRQNCPSARIVLHRTWAYDEMSDHGGFANYGRDRKKMFNAIVDTTSKVAEKYGFEIYYDCKFTEVEVPNGKICRNVNIVEPFLDADYIINIAKFKSHCMTMLSGATKNIFGTVPGLMKPELHFRYPEKDKFSSMLIDLAERFKPQLNIIDAIDAMEGDGPTGGVRCHIGLVITSRSSYSADVAAAHIMGADPMNILMLKEANSRGLCVSSVNELEIIGEDIASCVKADFKMPRTKGVDFAERVPKFLRPIVKKITTPKPVIKLKECIGCGKCAESCPRHTIVIKDRKAIIDYKNCINCFCCHEMCPMHVIDIKRFGAFRF